jgi:hypothetical protein
MEYRIIGIHILYSSEFLIRGLVDMMFKLEENLPNLAKGSVNKISAETDYEIRETWKNVEISGKLVVTREIKTQDRVTEIRDYIPIDVIIPKHRLIKKTAEVFLRLAGFNFGFDGDFTKFVGDLEITNISDDLFPQEEEKPDELIIEEI